VTAALPPDDLPGPIPRSVAPQRFWETPAFASAIITILLVAAVLLDLATQSHWPPTLWLFLVIAWGMHREPLPDGREH
jgi:fatty acid desaturase